MKTKSMIKSLWSKEDKNNEPTLGRGKVANKPIRVMIGTCPGSRNDTEALARSMIQRYFDIPDQSYFYIQKSQTGSYHYEIQEGGDGQAYLPSIIPLLAESEPEIVITPLSKRQVRITMKETGELACSVLSESASTLPETSRVKRKKLMTSVAKTGKELIKFGVMVFCLGLVSITIGGTINKGVELSAQGYYEVGERFSTERIIELLSEESEGAQKSTFSGLQQKTPLSQARRIADIGADPRTYVGKVEMVDGEWNVSRRPVEMDEPTLDGNLNQRESGQLNADPQADNPPDSANVSPNRNPGNANPNGPYSRENDSLGSEAGTSRDSRADSMNNPSGMDPQVDSEPRSAGNE